MKLAIGGDICITDASWENFESANEKAAFNSVIDYFKTADRVLVNLECALTDSDNRIKKFGPNLKAPKQTAETLKKAGVTDCALSNNHIFDFGVEGAKDTLFELEKANLNYTGFGDNYNDSRKNLTMVKDGVTITIIDVCEHEYSYATENRMGARPFDEFETMDDIREAKKSADYVIVIYHGGKEFCRYPSPRLVKACHEMVKCGADAIFCQHSHCVGCYEKFEDAHIMYGQGNFHFIKYLDRDGWNDGLLAMLDITKKGIDLEFVPVMSTEDGIDVADEKTKKEILDALWERSKSMQDGKWREGWHSFCESVYDQYKNAISGYKMEDDEDTYQLFSHYFDCEAHSDVWRELFPTWNKTNEL